MKKKNKVRKVNHVTYFLVHVWGCVEPTVFTKAYKTFNECLCYARIFVKGGEYKDGNDGLFYLVTQSGKVPRMLSFTNEELEGNSIEIIE